MSDCGSDTLYYRIFDDWDSDSYYAMGDNCDDIVGGFYDPTISCAPNSTSIYCDHYNDARCNDTSYNYTCNYNQPSNRYLCAPGDLSGKFGPIYFTPEGANFSYTYYTIYEMDDLMIDLDLLDGKSLVVQCSDTMEIVACAMFFGDESATTTMATTMMEPSNSGEESTEDSSFETSVQFGTILVVLSTMVKMMA